MRLRILNRAGMRREDVVFPRRTLYGTIGAAVRTLEGMG
jgi:hypothetical protein